MNNAETFATLTGRLAEAERNSNILLQAGSQERYLESYFLIASLQLQLERARNHTENLAAT